MRRVFSSLAARVPTTTTRLAPAISFVAPRATATRSSAFAPTLGSSSSAAVANAVCVAAPSASFSGSAAAAAPAGPLVLVSKEGNVGVLTLNRPKALNALCDALVKELNAQLKALDSDDSIGCIVITGSEKAFAAGADIKEMQSQTYMSAYKSNMLAFWHDLTAIRKPIIAAVNGYARVLWLARCLLQPLVL